jgi:hypothetical protein
MLDAQLSSGHACFLPAFFPYKVHIDNNELGHSYHIYTYGTLIFKYTIEVYIIEVYFPQHCAK